MAVQLNHTIVAARDAEESARFLADILGLAAPVRWGPFMIVEDANGTGLDFMDWGGDHEIHGQHYAFLVSEEEFDAGFARIRERGLPYWADPHKDTADQITHKDGGRGGFFDDPNGHLLELITVPYGGGSWRSARGRTPWRSCPTSRGNEPSPVRRAVRGRWRRLRRGGPRGP